MDGLMAGLLTSQEAPMGTTCLGDWLQENGEVLGRKYGSGLRRNFLWTASSVQWQWNLFGQLPSSETNQSANRRWSLRASLGGW